VGSTEIDPRLRLRLGVGVRLPKGLHSSPDFDSLVFLSDLTGKRGDPSWDEPSRLQQVAVHFVLDRASDTTERELHEEIGEPHVKVDGLRLALLRGDGE